MGLSTKINNSGLPNLAPKKLVLAASIAALFCGISAPVFSADSEALIDKLREKGVLSEEEYQEMRTEARAERRAQALKEANEEEKKAKKAESAATELTGRFKDGFSWESGDKQHSISLSGRVHADFRSFDIDSTSSNTADTFDIRRAYLGVSGKLYNDWTFEATSDIAASTLEYAYVNYKASDSLQFRMGAFKMPFSFEELTSSRFIDFQERSLVNAFVPAKDQGLMIHGEPLKNTFGYALAVMNGSGKNTDEANAVVDDKEFIARGALNFGPMANLSDAVLHLGVGYTTGTLPGNAALTSGIRTEGRGITFLTVIAPTGAAANSETDRERLGLEGVVAWGPLKLQTEWVKSAFENSSVNYDREIDAYYAALSWLITGEKYADFYTLGGMRAIVPNKQFKKGAEGMGAWELGVRMSKIDAGDLLAGEFTGTKEADAITVGLKWVPVTPVRVYLNYTQTDFDTPIAITGGTADQEKAITLRTSVFF
ncbi:MAG TPA: porin [Burkholderiales bacterium]|jgi:phosphate-selective porin OprO/OprP|nr:porin [Burkholderiales bacterium]